MAKRLVLGEVMLATCGLALLRNQFQGSDADAEQRIAEIRSIIARLDDPESNERFSVETYELGVRDGYARWADSYDGAENPLIDLEERVLTGVLDRFRPGTALDVACGTGRIAALLEARGHTVLGVDQSPQMLARARERGLRCEELSIESLSDAGLGPFGLVTCGLSLTHVAALNEAIASLASALEAGGALVITDVHPAAALLDFQAFFPTEKGDTAWVRTQPHRFGDYLTAFRGAGLTVEDCVEVAPGDLDGPMRTLVGSLLPAATRSAYRDMPLVVIWVLRANAQPPIPT